MATIAITRQKVGQKFCSLYPRWYKDFKWIHFCVIKRKFSASIVFKATIKAYIMTMTKMYEDAFIIEGFSNWKKAQDGFNRHQVSECHKKLVLRFKCFNRLTGIPSC